MNINAWLTSDQVEAIGLAVSRENTTGITWAELKDMTIADMCSANQDALIDDWFEEAGTLTDENRAAILSAVRTYDELLGTGRAAELTRS